MRLPPLLGGYYMGKGELQEYLSYDQGIFFLLLDFLQTAHSIFPVKNLKIKDKNLQQ